MADASSPRATSRGARACTAAARQRGARLPPLVSFDWVDGQPRRPAGERTDGWPAGWSATDETKYIAQSIYEVRLCCVLSSIIHLI